MNRSHFARLASALIALSMALAAHNAMGTLIPHPFVSDSFSSPLPSLSILGGLSIANDGGPLGSRVYFGRFDLNNNDLIVQAPNEATALANYANIFDMVRSGFNHGDWAGNGITSGIAKVDHTDGYESTAVGVILNDDGSGVNSDGSGNPIWGGGNSLLGSFDGDTNLSQYDVIVKYTFFGDTLLRGLVDGTDLTTVADGRANALKGWMNGEFNYTGGTVSNLDVLETQRTLTYESRYPINTPVADPPPPLMPEPSSLILAAAGLGFALSMRCKIVRRRPDRRGRPAIVSQRQRA